MNDEILRLLDEAIAETRRLGRADLAGRLAAQRDQVTSGAWHVLVAGEFKKGKSALVNALLGVPVCGADAAAFTAVPTIIRYGTEAGAELVLDSGQRRRIDVRAAGRYANTGTDGDIPLQAVEVTLPRELLREGLVLVDTPGIGGGFAAAQAAATMRAMSLADSVLIVSDASQEYTAAEVEFLRRAEDICPDLLCLLTKTDFYPEWQKILEINRGHLRRAGLKVEILPVSSVLRDVAVEAGDATLNGESGFPALVSRLRGQLSVRRAERSAGPATEAVRSCMRQVAGTLTAEHEALTQTQPEQRTAAIARLERVQERAQKLVAPSSRWLNTVNDRFADLQSRVDEDLQARIRKLDQEAGERIRAGDPVRGWAEFVPWLYQRTNDELTDCHRHLLALIDEVAAEVAGQFEDEADLGRIAGGITPPTAGEGFALQKLSVGSTGKLELAMHAARGWSLSSSVVTTMLVVTLHPGLLVILPITAALGTVFGVKAVHGFKTARLEQGRNEALRSVANYLNQARVDANRAALNILRHARSNLRDYYLDRANELATTANTERDATLRAVRADASSARQRASETASDLARVKNLLTAAERNRR
jgi:dynamin family protein